jgi:tetratricopeptide (TPR) repeat protein
MDDPQTTQTIELSEAQTAYQMALQALDEALPRAETTPVIIDPTGLSWPRLLLRALLALPMALMRGLRIGLREIGGEIADWLRAWKGRLARFAAGQPAVLGGQEVEARHEIRRLLLQTLWARDHVQEAIERRDGASYVSKRQTLTFVMQNESRLQRLGQFALEVADLDTADLRDMQPTPPSPERWWWFLNYPRAKRARRMNTLWFIMALVPALSSIVLITLLAQRLAINGPDLLSSASVIAQVGLGLASIIAGREILRDLILSGVSGSVQGKITFALASLFLLVTVLFYFVAPPGAALIYHLFGQRAVDQGNAAEAELYLESAARLDPDPHAASLLEVGCLYQTLGAPDRAQSVFERVLEADSRLLLARYHLAQLYSDQGDYGQALQLLEDGLNLLDRAREDMANGQYDFLPGVDTKIKAFELEYLLRLARGRAYLESGAPEQAKTNLRDAEDLFDGLTADGTSRGMVASSSEDMACGPQADRRPFVVGTELALHYYLALTYDALCDDQETIQVAQQEWRLVRNGLPSNSRQEAWRDDAVRRLSSGATCETEYGLLPGEETGAETPPPSGQ